MSLRLIIVAHIAALTGFFCFHALCENAYVIAQQNNGNVTIQTLNTRNMKLGEMRPMNNIHGRMAMFQSGPATGRIAFLLYPWNEESSGYLVVYNVIQGKEEIRIPIQETVNGQYNLYDDQLMYLSTVSANPSRVEAVTITLENRKSSCSEDAKVVSARKDDAPVLPRFSTAFPAQLLLTPPTKRGKHYLVVAVPASGENAIVYEYDLSPQGITIIHRFPGPEFDFDFQPESLILDDEGMVWCRNLGANTFFRWNYRDTDRMEQYQINCMNPIVIGQSELFTIQENVVRSSSRDSPLFGKVLFRVPSDRLPVTELSVNLSTKEILVGANSADKCSGKIYVISDKTHKSLSCPGRIIHVAWMSACPYVCGSNY